MSTPVGISDAVYPLQEAYSSAPLAPLWSPDVDGYGRGSMGSTAGYGYYATSIDDRDDGRCVPLYRTEVDLQYQRAQARGLDLVTQVPTTAIEALARYVFGSGWKPTVQPRKGLNVSPELVATLQAMIEDICERNALINGLDLELHARYRQDGEFIASWSMDREGPLLSVHEPDQLTEPQADATLYDYVHQACGVDCSAFVPSWSFGVLSPRRRSEQHLAYFIAYNGSGTDWEVLPESRTVHARRNVVRSAKRGVTDFAVVLDTIRQQAQLLRGTTIGATLQANIAYIEEYAAGVTKDQATAGLDLNNVPKAPLPGTTGPSTPQYLGIKRPGTILKVSQGKQYKPGPMGSERVAGFEIVSQMALRAIGTRWLMPEYMISGDASNANYSSTLVSESPFVKYCESSQQTWGSITSELLWKALYTAWEHGRLDRLGYSIRELKGLCEIVLDWPQVGTRNVTEQLAKLQFGLDRGLIAPNTAAAELGYDYDQEVEAGAKAAPAADPMAMFGAAAGAPAAGTPAAAAQAQPDPATMQAVSEQIVSKIEANWLGRFREAYP